MKKLLYLIVAMAAGILAASCQQEFDPLKDGDTAVTFRVSTDELVTKAGPSPIANGKNIDVLYWEIYGSDVTTAAAPLGKGKVTETTEVDGHRAFDLELKLIADQDYNIIFWAQVDQEEGKEHYVWDDLRDIKIKTYADENANDESRAAFFRVFNFQTENGKAITEDIELYRPFSQLNLGTTTYETDLNQINGGSVVVNSSEVTVTKLANRFNTLDGIGESDESFDGVVTFKASATPNGVEDATTKLLVVGESSYYWIGMNYLIVEGKNSSDNVKVDIVLNTNMGKVCHSVDNVPIKENYRTNILGNFLTTGATFKVIVDEEFIADINGDVDGNFAPAYNKETKTWEITNAWELSWVSEQVNSGNTFKGETVLITSDIDFNGETITPIGTSGKPFMGTFKGSDLTKTAGTYPTISNFVVKQNSYAGLIGKAQNAKIENFNVSNASIEGNHYGAAAVAFIDGEGYIKNVHVYNSTVRLVPELLGSGKYDNGDKAGAIAGYVSGEDWTLSVSECSATSVDIFAYRDLGGLVGTLNGKYTSLSNCALKDVTITADTDYEYKDGSDTNAGAAVGRIMNGATVSDISGTDQVKMTIIENRAGLEDGVVLSNEYVTCIKVADYDKTIRVSGKGCLELVGVSVETASGAAVELADGADVTLEIDNATLIGASDGIRVPASAKLTVSGKELKLEGKDGSGIGYKDDEVGEISISFLDGLSAIANEVHSYGIGGTGATVKIDASVIDYVSGGCKSRYFEKEDLDYGKKEPEGGPAIGGASIVIENSTIKEAHGGSKAAAIGAQYWSSTEITIKNSTLTKIYGGNASAGIGGSRYNKENKYDLSIEISDSNIEAFGGQFAAGIGAGYDVHCNGQNHEAENHIVISTSRVYAEGGQHGAGIGTGYHSAYLSGSIDERSEVIAVAGASREKYTIAQEIGYGVVDPAREYSGKNAEITFTVKGRVIEAPVVKK